MMKKEIYIAAATGDVVFLKEVDVEAAVTAYSSDDLVGLTSHGNNIIHVAAEQGRLDFIKLALECFSTADQTKLICGTNNDGNAPLHLAAKLPNSTTAEYLIAAAPSPSYIWRAENNKGNTPLHVALMNGGKSVQVAAFLLGVGPEVASYANHRQETPLHLAVQYDNEGTKTSMKNLMNTLNGLGASLDYTECLFEDDSLTMINLLLKTATTSCCLRDQEGMTPLLRATLNSYLPSIESIINYCPESIEICDPRGRTILHHIKLSNFLQARKFLRTPGISALIDRQDDDGNTPLHIAILNSDYNMVRAMFECNANFAIKNNEGNSPAALIQSNSSPFLNKMKDAIRGTDIINNEVASNVLFEAAYHKNWKFLLERLEEEDYEKWFLSRLPDGSNIVHLALQSCVIHYNNAEHLCSLNGDEEYLSNLEAFIVGAPNKFPILICQTDCKGRTVLHHAMDHDILKPSGRAFKRLTDLLRRMKDQPSCAQHKLLPWEIKDYEGDTLLHLALRFRKYKFVELLIDLDVNLVKETNHNKETPLHILCWYGRLGEEDDDLIELLLEKDVTNNVDSFDADGFTPLLRAVQNRALKIATRILQKFPQSMQQRHSHSNRTIFHLMDLDPNNITDREFSKLPNMENLLECLDHKANTPLHLAIEQGRYGTAQILMEHLGKDITKYHSINGDGKSVMDVLAQAQQVPLWFEDFLSSKWLDLPFGDKDIGTSIYGARLSDAKEYMGPLGVVAALLTAITFTAVFTVPGGYDETIGTPILLRKVAFQVFILTDVVGMCSSIMVLFCLLWFLNSGRVKEEGSNLINLSIALLQLSFQATLLAFMTGVYVTAVPKVQWLAIFVCVLCSIVLVLLRKHFILDFVVPVFDFVYFTSKLRPTRLAHFTRLIGSCLKSRNQDIL